MTKGDEETRYYSLMNPSLCIVFDCECCPQRWKHPLSADRTIRGAVCECGTVQLIMKKRAPVLFLYGFTVDYRDAVVGYHPLIMSCYLLSVLTFVCERYILCAVCHLKHPHEMRAEQGPHDEGEVRMARRN